ncbi:MAG: PD-(D/E)XK nuclease family protein [Nitrosopumilaceae archaeon]|uniref:PD-(D/E)XK nuclease family protein n=1 Tax=Candidatus Nitrosomaritimum aestuariumsis TaxID=3342354 RepID=A0AC60W3J3_9ARCH|nr:PD-(D/E)XK nuclease family protein [Nitrosopumilaceae archaeon]
MLQKTQSIEKQQSLQQWREKEIAADYITQEAAIIGSETHKLIEDYLHGKEALETPRLLSEAHFNNLLPLVNKIDDIHGIELRLYSDKMKLAGTSDCIAKYDGVVSIIDYKTKRSNQKEEWLTDHFIQATSYGEMFRELTGIKIEQIVILVSSEKNTRMEFVKNPNDYLDALDTRVSQYYSS